MDKNIKITVEGGEVADRQLLTAFFNVAFRSLGAYPAVVSANRQKIVQLGADDYSLGNAVAALLTLGGVEVSLSDGSVEAGLAAMVEKAPDKG